MEKEDDLPKPEGAGDGEETVQGHESVRVIEGALGLFTTPEIGAETEQEVKTRRNLNAVVHRMLVSGLIVCVVTLFTGLALSAAFHQPIPSKVAGFREIARGMAKGAPASVLSLGILLLIATPVFRVLGSLVEFILMRDWRYAGVTFLVVLILTASVILGSG